MAKEALKKEEIIEMTEQEHKEYHRKLVYIFIVIVLFLLGGSTFYFYIEQSQNLSYLDWMYFSAYTMTTVGYGDITPKTNIGKMFTIFYVFTGVGIALYGLSLISAHFVERREEFWLERIWKLNIGRHTGTFWGKIKGALSFRAKQLETYGLQNRKKVTRQK